MYVQKGLDNRKDQSYSLWGLSQEQLNRTILPIGKYTKPEIRKLANEYGYHELATKKESYEICFIPDNNYRDFLKMKNPHLTKVLSDGNILDINGKVIGNHPGYPFFTIGQRKGINVALGKPAYVTHINPNNNTITCLLYTSDAADE